MYQYKLIDCSQFLDEAVFDDKLHFICEERRQRITKLKNKKSMAESLGASVVLEELLGAADISGPLVFEYGKTGKPYLKNTFSDNRPVYISISHKYPMAAAIISDKPVGIDIERLAPFKDGIMERFFTESDCRYINAAEDEAEVQLRFYKVWTFKEAYCKAKDISLAENLNLVSYDENLAEHFVDGEFLVTVCP